MLCARGHAGAEGAAAALSRGLADTPAETWLAVVPQVIARLGSESERVRTFVLSLLSTLAERHPQGLVYPLTVAATSPLRAQATGAAHVLAHLRRGRDVLVEQAQLVAAELVRASCLWSEAWIDGLETASKAFYTEGDDAGCVRALLPLHEALERGAQTPAEGAFVREFGGALDAARAELRQWQESGERAHLHSAWALYMGLFRAVSPRQAALTSLDLASVSPRLLGATALELAVPGTYEPQAPLVTISGFRPRLSVIASKQRPRRVMLAGDDGRRLELDADTATAALLARDQGELVGLLDDHVALRRCLVRLAQAPSLPAPLPSLPSLEISAAGPVPSA